MKLRCSKVTFTFQYSIVLLFLFGLTVWRAVETPNVKWTTDDDIGVDIVHPLEKLVNEPSVSLTGNSLESTNDKSQVTEPPPSVVFSGSVEKSSFQRRFQVFYRPVTQSSSAVLAYSHLATFILEAVLVDLVNPEEKKGQTSGSSSEFDGNRDHANLISTNSTELSGSWEQMLLNPISWQNSFFRLNSNVIGSIVGSIPENLDLECASEVPPAQDLQIVDTCGGSFFVSPEELTFEGFCANDFTILRIWRYTDHCLNRDSVVQVIRVRDSEAPQLVGQVPPSMEVSCASEVPPAVDLEVVDNCDGSMMISPEEFTIAGGCANDFTVVRIWRFGDQCFNRDSAFQVIRVLDFKPPELIDPVPPSMEISCASEVPPAVDLEVVDNCNGSMMISPDEFTIEGGCANDLTIVRIWRFGDQCFNRDSAFQVIRVLDFKPPELIDPVPPSMEISCASEVPPAVDLQVVDNCNGSMMISPDEFTIEGGCANDLTIVRIWRFGDQCFNRDSAFQVIRVLDFKPPELIDPVPASMEISCASEVPPAVDLEVVDNCDGSMMISPEEFTIAGGCANDFTVVRIWRYGDRCFNRDSVVQVIRVSDFKPPELINPVPASMEVSCASEVPPAVDLEVVDNCDGSMMISPEEFTIAGGCANDFTVVRIWRYGDQCFNRDSVVQVIRVSDFKPPELINPVPASMEVSCASEVPPAVDLEVVDNCDGSMMISPEEFTIAGGCANDFTVVRIWRYGDRCFNRDSVVQVIRVYDENAPSTPDPPADITVQCVDDIPPPSSLTAIDNCGQDITVRPTEQVTPGDCPNDLVMLRTWTFTDICGNSSSVSQTITVADTKAPDFNNCPADVMVDCNLMIPAVASLTATDNCDGTIAAIYNGEVRTDHCDSDFYTLTRTWSATDACGNTGTCIQIITVKSRLSDPCFTIELDISYNSSNNTTTFNWELCVSDTRCQDLSNIRFSLPCGLSSQSISNVGSSVSGVISETTGRPHQCGRYALTFEDFADDGGIKHEPNGCAMFYYALQGDHRLHKTDVSVKAGREEGLGFDQVGLSCVCEESIAPHADAFTTGPLRGDVDNSSQADDKNQVSLEVFPNPASNEINIRLKNFNEEFIHFQLVDMLGRTLFVQRLINTKPDLFTIPVPGHVSDGLYNIRILNATELSSIPIIISH